MVSRQSNHTKSLSCSQNSPILLSGSQDNPTLLSPYLSLKAFYPYQVLIILEPFQTWSLIISGNSQRLALSSQYTLAHTDSFAGIRPLSSSQYTLTNTNNKADNCINEEV